MFSLAFIFTHKYLLIVFKNYVWIFVGTLTNMHVLRANYTKLMD